MKLWILFFLIHICVLPFANAKNIIFVVKGKRVTLSEQQLSSAYRGCVGGSCKFYYNGQTYKIPANVVPAGVKQKSTAGHFTAPQFSGNNSFFQPPQTVTPASRRQKPVAGAVADENLPSRSNFFEKWQQQMEEFRARFSQQPKETVAPASDNRKNTNAEASVCSAEREKMEYYQSRGSSAPKSTQKYKACLIKNGRQDLADKLKTTSPAIAEVTEKQEEVKPDVAAKTDEAKPKEEKKTGPSQKQCASKLSDVKSPEGKSIADAIGKLGVTPEQFIVSAWKGTTITEYKGKEVSLNTNITVDENMSYNIVLSLGLLRIKDKYTDDSGKEVPLRGQAQICLKNGNLQLVAVGYGTASISSGSRMAFNSDKVKTNLERVAQ